MAYIEEAKRPQSMHPKKFALWLFIVTIVMVFASLTSYYIVRKSEGTWVEFDLPFYFWINSLIILVSSGTIHWAYLSAKKDDLQTLKIALIITTFLGFAFLVGQYFSWQNLIERGIFFTGRTHNVAGSLIYVFSGLHGFHLIAGIIFLIVVLSGSLNSKIHSKNIVQLEMCATYWHFLDGLWIYLFVFLLLNH